MGMELNVVGDGDVISSSDHRFCIIGEALPIAGGGDIYDSENPPAQPLAVSQRSRLLFVAHSNGFYVARTKEVMAAAAAAAAITKKKEEGSVSSVEELSTINISSIGRVCILALSSLDSWLAACVEEHIHFFSMSALLHKDHHPSFSVVLDQSVKDLKWAPQAALEKHYLALSTAGTLYHGSGPASPDVLRTNVDSVEWSANGDFIAVAQKNIITLLTSKFEEKTSFSLSPDSIIVDSIRWVSAGKIILGCFEHKDDPDQPTYVVRVISAHDNDITNISSNPSIVVFDDLFLNYQCDAVPGATGPNLFVSYLENCELAIVANRKNLYEHIVLLGEDNNREAAMVELADDAWRPSIVTQENGDENLVLALSVDKVSYDENMKFVLGEEQKEVSPCCVLLCVTVDGKITLFHFASAADINSSRKENMLHTSPAQEYDGLSNVNGYDIQDNQAGSVNSTQSSSISSFGSQTQKSDLSFQEAHDDTLPSINKQENNGTQPSELAKYPVLHTEHSPFKASYTKEARDVWKTETPAVSEAKAHADVMSEKLSTSKSIPASGSFKSSVNNIQLDPRIAAPSSSLRNSFLQRASDDRSTSSLSIGAVSQFPSQLAETSVPAARLSFSGQKAAAMADNRAANFSSQVLSQQNIATSYPERSNHEQTLSSQFSNVEVLVNKMDQLLEDIQGPRGFKDASITSQEGSVAAVEEGLSVMSEQCRMWRGTLEGQLKEIQLLLDKTMQVRARKVYMEGIFQQANDNWYSELWNGQKLSLELDLKRQHIVEVDQELASQLVQLERHFNTIELNKFGQSSVFQENQKAIRSGYGKPRLRSLQNTVSSQLVAAENLNVRLRQQMAALNLQIQDSKQNVKREVFETLGLPYDGAYNSSVKGKGSDSQSKDLMMSSSSVTAKPVCRTNLFTPVKSSEPQTVRRRNSLEQMKSSSVRAKVTVKRILLQEDPRNCENRDLNLRRASPVSSGFSDAPEKSVSQYKSKNSSKTLAKPSIEGSHWTAGADRGIEDLSAKRSVAFLEDPRSTGPTKLNGSEKNPSISWKFTGKASGSDEYAQQSENFLSGIPSISERTPLSMTSKESPSFGNGFGTLRSATGEVKTTPLHEFHVRDSIFTQSASVSSGFSSPPHSPRKVLETKFPADEIRPGQKTSFPALQSNTSASNQVSSSAASNFFPNMTMGLKSHDTSVEGLSSTSHAKLDTDQKKLQSSRAPTFLKESSETPESGSQPTADVFGTISNDDSSMKQKVISSSSLARVEMPKAETSVLLDGLPSDSNSSLRRISEISSTQAAELPVILQTENQPNPDIKPNSTYGSSVAPIFSGTSLVGEDLTNNEDEMEEEAPESSLTPELTLGNLGGFGFGSSTSSSAVSKPNPFGVGMINNSAAPIAMTTQAGELFRPASFNLQSAFPSQPSIAANISLFGSGIGNGSSSLGPPSSDFGQPPQFSSGQQALGSVLGAFGQSRQLGASPPGNSNVATSGGFSSLGSSTGGFASLSTGGGFGAAATVGGGFGAAATVGGGFASVARGGFAAPGGTGGGGFAAAAGTGGGGFAAAAGTGGGGFAAAAGTGGGGFAAAAGTGGAFGNPGGGFSGAGGPPSNLFTQMRK